MFKAEWQELGVHLVPLYLSVIMLGISSEASAEYRVRGADVTTAPPPPGSQWLSCTPVVTEHSGGNGKYFKIGQAYRNILVVNPQANYFASYHPDIQKLSIFFNLEIGDVFVTGYDFDGRDQDDNPDLFFKVRKHFINRITMEYSYSSEDSSSYLSHDGKGSNEDMLMSGPCTKISPLPVGGGQKF